MKIIFVVGLIVSGLIQAENVILQDILELPLETVIIEPASIENVSIWVPAVKSGPFINRSCRVQQDLMASSMLPASVDHRKDIGCPEAPARILAELMSGYYEAVLPLTIFNGWQWEYSYSLCQFENSNYSLPERGGSWENCQEAVLSISVGRIVHNWLYASPVNPQFCRTKSAKSTLTITIFSSMRTRDGYPKERKL